jgi:hypothetical protein
MVVVLCRAVFKVNVTHAIPVAATESWPVAGGVRIPGERTNV